MRTLAAVAAVIVAGVLLVVVILTRSQTPDEPVQIHMGSDPFPSSVGSETLQFWLTKADGTQVADASLEVTANMMMEGMLPLPGRPGKVERGEYPFAVIWPMAGEWQVSVLATLPNGRTVQDRFDIYVYPVPPRGASGETTYRSESEIAALVEPNAAHEYWIVIPQGTMALQRSGQGENLVPSQIDLSLTGQNILVIRNDDIADHTVGPFFVRAGETIRQEFTRAAEYTGKCTLRHGDEVSIIVE